MNIFPFQTNIAKGSTHVDYILSGTRKDFIIKEAVSSTRYVVSPHNELAGSITTYIR